MLMVANTIITLLVMGVFHSGDSDFVTIESGMSGIAISWSAVVLLLAAMLGAMADVLSEKKSADKG